MFGRGFIDQADAVLLVHHDDALAQVLHDVLRELREVGQVHVAPAHQRLAFQQPVGQRPHRQRGDEDDGAQDSREQVLVVAGSVPQLHEDLLHQDRRASRLPP